MSQSNELPVSVESAEIVERQDPPMTFQHKLRLWGTFVILAGVLWVVNFVVPPHLFPPEYDPLSLNEAQFNQEGLFLDRKKSLVTINKLNGNPVYLWNNQEWSHSRPDWLDEGHLPILNQYE